MDSVRKREIARFENIQTLLLEFSSAPNFEARVVLGQELVWAKRKIAENGCLRRLVIPAANGRQKTMDIFDRYFDPPPGESFTSDVITMIEKTKSVIRLSAQPDIDRPRAQPLDPLHTAARR